MALLQLPAGLSGPPVLPPLIGSSFVLHFRALSVWAWCQTPSGAPSPACHYCPGRWRWHLELLQRDSGRNPERERHWARMDAATQDPGETGLQFGSSWGSKVRNSPIS